MKRWAGWGKHMEKSGKPKTHVLRPLFWWLILVLVLYGIRTHRRLMEQTRLRFTVSMQGRPIDATALFDGKPAESGQNIQLGNHTFTVSNPKAEPFTTNLFVWYGGRDFGNIALKRLMGTLSIETDPAAAVVVVTGPELSLTLTNCASTNLILPTDQYEVWARYPYWAQSQSTVISVGMSSSCRFAPPMGTLHLSCNQTGATYLIHADSWGYSTNGNLPMTFARLPAGGYILTVTHHSHQIQKTLTVTAQATNEWEADFIYGAALLQTVPPGATVRTMDGPALGMTPLLLSELTPQTIRFDLEETNYESVLVTLNIVANQTNVWTTNLVNARYAAAMRMARADFDAARYDAAMQSAGDALKYMPGDAAATALERQATGMSHLTSARRNAAQNDLAGAIAELNTALESIPDNAEAKQLLADCTKRQADLAAQERKRQEEQLAAQERDRKLKELQTSFNVLLAGFEDSGKFAEHELTATNDAGAVGAAIKSALADGQPSFQIVRFEQPRPDIFALQARQLLGVGYRDCFVVGETVQAGETRILFKCVEYDHPPQLKLLGGLVTATVTQNPTPEQQAEFERQIQEGAPMVEARIRRAVGESNVRERPNT